MLPVVLDPFPVFSNAFTQVASPSDPQKESAVRRVSLFPSNQPKDRRQPTPSSTLLPTLLQAITLILSPTATSDLSPLPSLLPKLPTSLEGLYQACKTLILVHSKGGEIHDRVRLDLERSAGGILRILREAAAASDGEAWIEIVVKGWDWWSERVALLNSVLLPLDRSYVLVSPGVETLTELANETFKTVLFNNDLIANKTTTALVDWVTLERKQGVLPSRRLISSLFTKILNPLSLTQPLILPPLQTAATAFYSQSRLALPADASLASYFLSTESSLISEQDRLTTVFHLSKDAGGIVELVEKELLAADAKGLIEKGLQELMVGGKKKDVEMKAQGEKGEEEEVEEVVNVEGTEPDMEGLERMLRLLRRVGQAGGVKAVWGGWVQNHVEQLILDPTKDEQMVSSLLTFKQQINLIIAGPFSVPSPVAGEPCERDRVLADAANSAFMSGLAKRKNKPAEMIAKSIDRLLRSRTTSSDSLSTSLDELLTLVRYTRDKDVFKAFYVTGLAKRLLLGKSASDDAEMGMVERLKKELGDDFTTGDGMMADLNLSTELMKNYRTKNDASEDMDLSVSVLSNANWPSYPPLGKGWESFRLTPALSSALDRFKRFYTSAHQGRLLDWRYQLFSLSLKAKFPLGTKELSVSLFQALVLIVFNDEEGQDEGGEGRSNKKFTWEELKDRTGIESSELSRTLQSLACGRKDTRVLLKSPAGKDVNQTDTFAFNEKFTNDRVRIRINQIQQNQSAEEDQRTETRVLHDRSHLLDAAIVRIMKSKKTSTWIELVNLVVDAVAKTFPPEPKAIKQQIESLIEREYLARDEEDSMRVLHYLA